MNKLYKYLCAFLGGCLMVLTVIVIYLTKLATKPRTTVNNSIKKIKTKGSGESDVNFTTENVENSKKNDRKQRKLKKKQARKQKRKRKKSKLNPFKKRKE